jgi:hypothetical protein
LIIDYCFKLVKSLKFVLTSLYLILLDVSDDEQLLTMKQSSLLEFDLNLNWISPIIIKYVEIQQVNNANS